MKTSVKIFRILTCVFTAIYTILVGFHVGETAALKCVKIANVDGAYSLVFDRITSDAWFYIISGVALVALFAVAIVFLFRKGLVPTIVSPLSILIASIYSLSINTQLSEVTLWREPLRRLGVMPEQRVDACLSIKPGLARLCIILAVCYFIMSFIQHKKSKKTIGYKNEQNS